MRLKSGFKQVIIGYKSKFHNIEIKCKKRLDKRVRICYNKSRCENNSKVL
nr:MAG TPA: hypothetical protein [Inoviridae sp.]